MPPVKIWDVGANLTDKRFNKALPSIIQQNREAGVGCIVTGTTVANSLKALGLCYSAGYGRINYRSGVNDYYCTYGIHPHSAKTLTANDFSEKVNDPAVVAIGECGLDYDRMFSNVNQQETCFRKQITVAQQYSLPLFMHERAAHQDFVRILGDYSGLRGVVHCFTGTNQEAQMYLKMGFYIGITGFICNNNRNKDLLGAIRNIPMNRLLVETDAPYMKPTQSLPPFNLRKGTCVPVDVIEVIKRISVETGCTEEDIVQSTRENTRDLFTKISPAPFGEDMRILDNRNQPNGFVLDQSSFPPLS